MLFKEKLNGIDIQRFCCLARSSSLHLIPIRARQAITSTIRVGVSACIIGGVVTRGYTETMAPTLSFTSRNEYLQISKAAMESDPGRLIVELCVV